MHDDVTIPSELLERLRSTVDVDRQSGLRLDRQGRFWHDGTQVTHPRLRQALLRWLDRDATGATVIRLDADRFATLEVEDAELLVSSARWAGDDAMLALNDGSEEPLDGATLCLGDHDAMYCRVRGGRLEARLTNPAYYAIAERIEEVRGGFQLVTGGRAHLIGRRQR